MEKARESTETARSEYGSGRNTTAARNLYYACFYALTSVLLKEGQSFKKHGAVKRALHKGLIFLIDVIDTSSPPKQNNSISKGYKIPRWWSESPQGLCW
jgi:uncharacterized protein (UPF0332 family)